MNIEALFKKHGIRGLEVKLAIQNFDKYLQKQPKAKNRFHAISADRCQIILPTLETEKRHEMNKSEQ